MDGLYFTFVGGFWLFGSATNYYSPKLLHVTSLKFRVINVTDNEKERYSLDDVRVATSMIRNHWLYIITVEKTSTKQRHSFTRFIFFFLPTIRHLESIVFFCTVLLRTLGTKPSKFNLTWFVRAVLTVLTPEEKIGTKGTFFDQVVRALVKTTTKYHHHHHHHHHGS